MKSLGLALVTLSSLGSLCTAQFIPGVTTTTNMGTWFSYNILNLTNGLGLSSPTLAATHSANWQEMWISNNITTGWIQFDLGSVQPLNVIAVWNYNSSISLARGVALMDVLTSTDGVNFTLLSTEAPPQGTAQPIPAHLIPGNGVPAQYVRFDILQNYGDTYTGLAEVQFEAGSGAAIGSNTSLGQGCIRAATSFYELFATAAAFDLANSGLSMIPNATGYTVIVGASTYVPPSAAATPLLLANNAQVPVTLAAPFPYSGGSTSSLMVCSNGFVSVASGNTTSGTPSAATMLAAPQTAWWAWHDYNPAAVGSGQVKFEQIGGVAYITWDGVWDNGGTSIANANTLQFQFDTTSGVVQLAFALTMSGLGNGHLVGYSPGGPSIDPGSMDLSAAGPFTIGNVDILPLSLAGGTRPVIGTNWTLNVGNIPGTGVIGVDIAGVSDPGINDLFFIGMPGCGLRASLDALIAWPVVGNTHSYGMAIPNNAGLVGIDVFTTSAVFQVPPVNAFGAITANGIQGHVGNL